MSEQDGFSSLFAPEAEKAETGEYGDVWKVLLVDDEPDIHAVLRLALQDVEVEDRPLLLLNATSAEEARSRLREHPDIALILLDVVMETEQAGLDLVRYVRKELNNRAVQIVLVTGQPGYAPQREVVQSYEIDGYRLKSELSADKIFVTVYAALRTHLAMRQLEQQRELLLKSKAALRESEARYKRITEELTDYQYTVRVQNGRAVETRQSPACLIITGYTPEDFATDPDVWIQMVAPEDRELVREQIQQILEGISPPPIEHRIIRKDGQIRWVCDTIILNKDESGKLVSYDGVIKDITKLKSAESKISFLAYHDQLTELPNRELFYDRMSHAISQARRNHKYLALLFLDLDGFKTVNDRYGHEAGDTVLKLVARRLQACVRDVDTVARLGGDEFTLILSEVENPADVASIAEKIIQKVSEPVSLDDEHKCSVGASIGISIYPEDGYELDKLMSAADSAMYESKAGGKSSYTFFRDCTNNSNSTQPWIMLDANHLLGVPEIDDEHQDLISLINRLNDAVKQYAPAEISARIFDEVISRTRAHFESEERLMDQYGYAGRTAHEKRHQKLLNEVNYLRGKFIQGGELLVLQYIKDWLLPHISDMDRPLAHYLIQHGVKR
jgi:diguanylate cyclase (GGDEF)-like protein/hemerythrin-like metal-binding protein/PAS domain S-box-containing protein